MDGYPQLLNTPHLVQQAGLEGEFNLTGGGRGIEQGDLQCGAGRDSGADIEDQEYVVDAKEDLAASSHNVAS